MNCWSRAMVCAFFVFACLDPSASAGDLKKSYFGATKEGAWSQYDLTTKDGTVSVYSYERKPDENGRAVLELEVKTTAGAGAGSESTMTYTMPMGFDLARDGLSYGKFTEKMTMQYGEMVMPVDASTLAVIRDAEKDYRGKLTFTGTEKVGLYDCDRYTYALNGAGPVPTKESGTLWLNDAVPFAIVRHAGKVVNMDGAVASDFDMLLKDRGQIVMDRAAPVAEATPRVAPAPAVVTLAEGFKAGWIGIDLQTLVGGKQLRLNFRNEYAAQLTIELVPGPVDLVVDFPVDTLKISFSKAARLVLEAGSTSEAMVVQQRGPRGVAEGKCYLSVYEGTPVFQGSVTMDQLPK